MLYMSVAIDFFNYLNYNYSNYSLFILLTL